MQRRELRRDQVGCIPDVIETMFRGNRNSIRVFERGSEERALPVHLCIGDVRIPVGHRAPPRVRVEVHTCEPERRRQPGRGVLAVRTKRLSVLVQFSVVSPGTPAREHLLDCRCIHSKEVFERFEIGSKRNDGADVQVAVRPPVKPPSDPRARRSRQRSSDTGRIESRSIECCRLVP